MGQIEGVVCEIGEFVLDMWILVDIATAKTPVESSTRATQLFAFFEAYAPALYSSLEGATRAMFVTMWTILRAGSWKVESMGYT